VKDLREIVKAEVERVLAEFLAREASTGAQGAQSRALLVLFSGTRWPEPIVFDQLTALAQAGHRLTCVLSHSFRSLFGNRMAQSMFAPGISCAAEADEPQLHALTKQADALLVACLSPNSAAKLTLGLADSLPTIALRLALEAGKPVIVAEDSAALRQNAVPAGAPPKLRRLAEDAFHGLSEMGVRFVPASELGRAVDAAFFVPVNETPERLAKTRPRKQRMFVTTEDVWKAASQGHKQLVVPEDAVITDEARDQARRVGLEILRQ